MAACYLRHCHALKCLASCWVRLSDEVEQVSYGVLQWCLLSPGVLVNCDNRWTTWGTNCSMWVILCCHLRVNHFSV